MKTFHSIKIKQSLLARGVLLAVLISVSCLAGITTFVVIRGLVFPWSFAQLSAAGNQPTPALNLQGTPLPGSLPGQTAGLPADIPNLTPWDGASRVTILILGLDYRDWAADEGPSRSDTMILLTLDPITKTAGMLSIPRDMWVAIPGFQHGKINTAYFLGDAYKLPGGGPGLAIKTVEQFLGVPINYYAQIDFNSFVRFIDEIGGVKIDVPNKITIDLLGSGPRTKKNLKPGPQVLPGEWALAYARNRYTEGGDFDRAQRQQQVIFAIRDRILSANMLSTLITKAPTLYNELFSGIHTNLSLDQAIKLAVLARDVPQEKIKKGIFDKNYTLFGTSPDKLSILIPLPDKIHLLRDEIFSSSSALSPMTPGNIQEQMKAEAASLALRNGSQAGDLEQRAASSFRDNGVNVTEASAAGKSYGITVIVDHTGKPYLVKYLLETLKLPEDRLRIEFDPNSSVDVELFMGNDLINQTFP